jgi:uncharacterized protein with HEPN domain
MSRDEQERLRDIQDAIAAIRKHLAQAGETTAPPGKNRCCIPWVDIAGLRDLIAHEYFRIDIHRVLEIVERDLPPLEQAIEGLLNEA